MPTQLLSIGPPTVITQNVVYAMPVKSCTVTTTAALEKSVTGTSGWSALASGGSVTGGFIRCTTTSPTVTCTASAGGGGGGASGDVAVTSVATGTTPSTTGAVRLSNGEIIKGRNSGNTGDVALIGMSTSVDVGDPGATMFIKGTTAYFSPVLNMNGADARIYLYKRVASAPTGLANFAQLWTEDNGSGKMRLMVLFPTGAAIQLAIQL